MEENKQTDYISFEQKYGLSNFGNYFGRAFYGSIISMLRIPTGIRKLTNNQTILSENVEEAGNMGFGGLLVGGGGGAGIDGCAIVYSAVEAGKRNYAPLAFLVAANLVSLGAELNRFPKSKQEHLEMKAKKRDKKNQEDLEAKVQTPQRRYSKFGKRSF